MNKTELVNVVAKKCGVTKNDAQVAVDSLINTITDAVKSGDKVTLVGFGTFTSIERKARKGRNPQTGAPVNIPARKSPKFTSGKEFKQRVK